MPVNTTAGDFVNLYGDFVAPSFWTNYGVKSTGFVMPSFESVIQRQIDLFRDPDVYGPNLDIDPSSPQGQYIYNEAKDKYTLLLMAQAVYNSFNLLNSSGLSLDRNLQYVGIMRKDDSYSQVSVEFSTIDGITPVTLQEGYRIANQDGDEFAITNTITFTTTGTVTAIAVEPGAKDVSVGYVNTIINVRGNLDSVTNSTAGIEGSDVESDVEARQRGVLSPDSRSKSRIIGTLSQLKNLDGVLQVKAFENKSASSVGILLAHSVRYVVRGGSDSDIGNVLYLNEVPGISYVGDGVNTVTFTKTEEDGVETSVYFDRPPEVEIYVQVSISIRSFDDDIRNAILDYVNNTSYGFTIGEIVLGNKMYGAAYSVLQSNGVENDNNISSIQVSDDGIIYTDELVVDSDHIGAFSFDRIVFQTVI